MKELLSFSLIFFIVWIFFNGYPENWLPKPDELMAWIIYGALILICSVALLTVILHLVLLVIKKDMDPPK